jgi:hypothetical protein
MSFHAIPLAAEAKRTLTGLERRIAADRAELTEIETETDR